MPFGWSCSAAQRSPRPRDDCPPTPRGGAAGVAWRLLSGGVYVGRTLALDKASTAGHGFLAERVNRRADLAPLDGLVEGRQRLGTQERGCEEFVRAPDRDPRARQVEDGAGVNDEPPMRSREGRSLSTILPGLRRSGWKVSSL